MVKLTQIENLEAGKIIACFKLLEDKINQLTESFQPKESTEYLTASELRKLLKISKPTEIEWRRKGVIQAYKMGGRIYYKGHEVEKCMTEILNR